MTIIQRISADIVASQKAGETVKLEALRFVMNALKNHAKDLRQESLDDAEAIKVLQKEVKKHREAIAAFERGSRPELVAKEKAELDLLSPYLPQELSDAEIKLRIEKVVAESGLTPPYDFGRLMGGVMKEVAGAADGARVREQLDKFITSAT